MPIAEPDKTLVISLPATPAPMHLVQEEGNTVLEMVRVDMHVESSGDVKRRLLGTCPAPGALYTISNRHTLWLAARGLRKWTGRDPVHFHLMVPVCSLYGSHSRRGYSVKSHRIAYAGLFRGQGKDLPTPPERVYARPGPSKRYCLKRAACSPGPAFGLR